MTEINFSNQHSAVKQDSHFKMSSLYQQSIPVLIKYLENFAAILEKGRQYADEKGMKHEEMINFRLVADMRG